MVHNPVADVKSAPTYSLDEELKRILYIACYKFFFNYVIRKSKNNHLVDNSLLLRGMES